MLPHPLLLLMELRKSKLEACVQEIYTWMLLNKLKLNREKTELLLISSLHRARPPLLHLDVCDERVLTSPKLKKGNIGVIFDEYLSMVPQVTAMCKSAFYHLRNISIIRKYLIFDAAQIVVHALITSKLDCNSLLYGLPKQVTKQLQRVQNAAASLSPKFCHITPVLSLVVVWVTLTLMLYISLNMGHTGIFGEPFFTFVSIIHKPTFASDGTYSNVI